MNIKQKCYLVILCLLLMHTSLAKPSQGILVDKIIAEVDGQIILQSELAIALQQYLRQGSKESPELQCEVLRNMVFNKLLLAKALQEGVTVTDEEVAQELNRRMQYFLTQVGSEARLAQYWGKPIQEIKSELQENHPRAIDA